MPHSISIDDRFKQLRSTWRLYDSNRKLFDLLNVLLHLRVIDKDTHSDVRDKGWEIDPAKTKYQHFMCRLPESDGTDTATPDPWLGFS